MRDAENGAPEEGAGGDEEPGQRLLRFGDDGELALEGLAGAPEQCLDRADLHALVVGDLLVGPAGALAHGEHVAVAGGQAVERTVHQLAVDGGQDELLRGVVCRRRRPACCAVSSMSSVGVLRDRRRSMSVQMLPAITVSHG